MSEIERRGWKSEIEVRSEGGRVVASGIAIRYNSISKNLGGFVERILPGAARKTLKEQDILALHEHDSRMLLGRTSSGTLRLTDSGEELRYEIDLPDTTHGRDVAELLRRGDVKGSSFGFRSITTQETWEKQEDGVVLRTIGELSLRDVSTTCSPAYNETSATLALRSLAEARSLDIATVVAAAEAGELRYVIAPPPAGESKPDGAGAEGRDTPTFHRHPDTWLQ